MSARYLQNNDIASGLTSLPAGGTFQVEADQWHVVEWSPDQKCFHIQTLREALTINMRAFMENRATSYHPLGVFASQREASKAYAFLRRIRDLREGVEHIEELECEDDES